MTVLPSACTDAASRRSKECCPVPDGFGVPCGGPGRGACTDLTLAEWTPDNRYWIPENEEDVRFQWPSSAVSRVCQCEHPFYGPACEQCVFGRYGPDCAERKVLVRKSAKNLGAEEKAQYVRGVHDLKAKESAFRLPVLAAGGVHYKYVPVNIYDLFVWIHFLPIYKGGIHGSSAYETVNMAHDGSGFLTWHRLLLLWFERELQEVLHDPDFALPYWDWGDADGECSICTDELVGVADAATGFVGAPFANWPMICFTPDADTYCDHLTTQGQLKRIYNPDFELPTQRTVDVCLRLSRFDTEPFDETSSCSFRNCLEGYQDLQTGLPVNLSAVPVPVKNHNVVHRLYGGMADVVGALGKDQAAANDPIFHLHHNNVDRIFEQHLRRHSPEAMPSARRAPFGHGGEVAMVGLWPVSTHAEMFRDSRDLGYTFEFLDGRFPWDGDPALMPTRCNI